ncbi:eCIS core domain-containing protein [Aquimarina longa]|uniref:eCIS core domain-containing protein n=1 Tax=Aquimarina longa TaxID=1080221 RepID=UPI000783C97B|nr:DUF4157 domain-containing protein [Aquimarina longa]
MKVAEVQKSTTAKNTIQKKRQPFFNKGGEGSFFSKSKEATTPFFTPTVQPKLKVGKPNDKYEVEADQVAEKVIDKTEPTGASGSTSSSVPVQTKTEEDTIQEKPIAAQIQPIGNLSEVAPVQREEEEDIQKKEDDEENIQMMQEEEVQKKEGEEELQQQEDEELQKKDDPIQTKSANIALPSEDFSTTLRSSKGQGSALSGSAKTQMESGFGADFSGVKIHTDSKAVAMNKTLGAQAFTNKNDIYFNENKFNPATQSGQTLLAHELTHTIQQGASGPASQSKVEPDSEVTTPTTVSDKKEASEVVPAKGEAQQPSEGGKQPATTTPRSAEEDPNFKKLEHRVGTTATEQQTHQPATTASSAAQAAAVSPTNERASTAQAAQVETMEEQEAGEFNAATFKAQLMQRIESMELPKDEDQADDFENNNNINEVVEQGTQDASAERDNAAGAIASTTQAAPNTSAVPERQITPLQAEQSGGLPASVGANQAMPPSRGNAEVNQPLTDNMSEVDQQMSDNQITDEQLANSNEPQFTGALGEKQKAKSHTQNAPNQFRQQEQGILANARVTAENKGQQAIVGMHGDRTQVLGQVQGNQQQTSQTDTAERTRIANEINTLYETTKTDVETILSDLDSKVHLLFKAGASLAKQAFEDFIEKKMDKYREERYGGVSGFFRRIGDVFTGLPDEVNKFFVEGRQVFIDKMDSVITTIATVVADKLTEAKTRITKGQQEVQEYVTALPQELQNIGKEAADGIQNKFDELTESVDSKQEELIDSLAEQYNEQLQVVDARIEEMKSANRGLIDMALDAIGAVIKVIMQIKNVLTNLLSTALEAIGAIIRDPIGFLSNLISGISLGFTNFGKNIFAHLQSGLIKWLTGTLGPVGITMPENLFSLEGIFSLVSQILGVTWDFIRRKAVKVMGEKMVSAMETGFELFLVLKNEGISGLWKHLKEEFQDLKETVLDAIKSMVITTVIEAGIKWVLGLMNPAGAFVKAAMAIIEIVKFFVERGSQILELVNAFIAGIKAVASGSVQKVAQTIEKALATALPVVIGFLAALLGISKIASKVQKIVKKVRKRIDKAINKLLLKAKKAFKKLVRKGKAKVKGAVAGIIKWWKAKKKFKGKDGKQHKLFFKGSEKSAVLMVASTPENYLDFIKRIKIPKENKSALNTKINAKAKAVEVDKESKRPLKGANEKEKEKDSKKKKFRVKAFLTELAPLTAILMGIQEGELPKSIIVYNGQTSEGFAKRVEGRTLSREGEPGSTPQETNTAYETLFMRKLGNGIYYVRGHMINEHLHGPGKLKNLTPLSVKGNKNHLKAAEDPVKIAVRAGAVVRYTVSAKYDRPKISSETITDDEFERAGIPEEERGNVKKIRKIENKIPSGLMLGADVLKKNSNGKWVKDKTIVSGRGIINPIDTNLSSYKTTKRVIVKAVGIKSSSIQELKDATGIAGDIISVIKNSAILVPGTIFNIGQIKNKLPKADGYMEEKKILYQIALDKISGMDRSIIKFN